MANPRTAAIRNANGTVVCYSCLVADSPLMRHRGLLGRAPLLAGEGLLLSPTGSIHTWFMNFPIDAVFLDRDWRVLHIAREIKPWRAAAARRARAVLELRAGDAALRGLEVGDVLELAPAGL
jgi:uncharacterized membrane protein (UPF0127 family)